MPQDDEPGHRAPLTREDGSTVSARDVEVIRREARRAARAMVLEAVLGPPPVVPDQRSDDDPA